MAATSNALLTVGITPTATLTQYRAVSDAGALPAAGARMLGIAQTAGVSAGARVPVVVAGTSIAEAGAAIAAGALVELDASGRVITRSTGVVVGKLMPGSVAGASGDLVEILIGPNAL
jgi:hypothetical protein